MHGMQRQDRRADPRTPHAARVWWLGERDENFRAAWATDHSLRGLAFVTGAGARVAAGQTVRVSRVHPRRHPAACETLRVCRVEPYGATLDLVACARLA